MKARSVPVVFLVLALLSSACGTIMERIDQLPRLQARQLKFDPPQTSRIYASDGRLITTLHGVENRTVVRLGRISELARQAVVAIEDERFFEHGGIDVKAIARAAVENVAGGEVLQGGSTITQQYVKIVIISPNETADESLDRKIEEAALARQLEKRLGKREILERYLNAVYFGSGAYGIQAAAKTFFRVPARKLNLRQSALLAGIIRNPSIYNPYRHPGRAKNRRNTVLDKMADVGAVSKRLADRASRRPLDVRARRGSRYPAPYFVDYVKRLLTYDPRFEMLGETPKARSRKLLTGGLRIFTTVDLRAQRAAENAVNSVLTERSDPHGSLVALEPGSGRIRAMVGGRDFFVGRKRDPFSKLNLAIGEQPHTGPSEQPPAKKGKGRHKKGRKGAGGGATAGPNEARKGKDADKGPLDLGRGPGTGRQAGSAFKPFALVTALSQGIPLFKAFKAPSCISFPEENNGEPWNVCNYGLASYGKVSLLQATINSINVVYAQLILEVGSDEVVRTARRMGIRTQLAPVPSAVLGANPVNALGMASAYGTFATNGERVEPIAISKIVDRRNNVIFRAKPRRNQVIDPAAAYLTTTALEQVISGGTGTAAQIGRPAAGKTGTNQEYRDAWFAGYTPDLAAAVWVGYPEASISMKTSCTAAEGSGCRPTRITVAGGTWPAMIWQRFMSTAHAELAVRDFVPPATGLTQLVVDGRTGCLAAGYTPARFRVTVTVTTETDSPAVCAPPPPKPEKDKGKEGKEGKDEKEDPPPGDGDKEKDG